MQCVCVSVCARICFPPCVAVSLHNSHPSIQPFATWLVNYLFLFTHAHKENKPLSDCLDRPHSPSAPLPTSPLPNISVSFLRAHGSLQSPGTSRSVKLSATLANFKQSGGLNWPELASAAAAAPEEN